MNDFTDNDLKNLYKNCYIDRKGYYRFRDSRKYFHIWVMEKKIGKKLRKGEVVHHINGNKLDNNPSNLMVFSSQEEHHEWHQEQKDAMGVW